MVVTWVVDGVPAYVVKNECHSVWSRFVYFRLRQMSSVLVRSRRLETSASLHLKTRTSLVN